MDTPPRGASAVRNRTFILAAAALLLAALLIRPHDEAVAAAIRAWARGAPEHPWRDVLAFVRPWGKGAVLAFLALVAGAVGARRRALGILLALLCVVPLVWPLKFAIGRERPNRANTLSFPSGDTAAIAAFTVPLLNTTPWAAPLGTLAIAAVAAGRLYDGAHYPSDVLTGAALGLLAGLMGTVLLARRRSPPARRWWRLASGGMLITALVLVAASRGTPPLVKFLITWGPAGLVLTLARAARSITRRWAPYLAAPLAIRHHVLLALLLVLLVYGTLAASSTLWDRDEPRFARATVEMLASGNLLYPTFNGRLRPDKPILLYWLMAIPVRLFGPAELACRSVAVVSAGLVCLLTAWFAHRLGGPLAGLLAAGMLGTTPLLLVSGTAATTDALLLLTILAALAAYWRAHLNGFHWTQAVFFGLATGAALLTKGPVGLLLILLIVGCSRLGARGRTPVRARHLLWFAAAALAGIGLFLAWAWPANVATSGEFFRLGIGRHVVHRALEPMESHGGRTPLFIFYYLPVLLVALFPWTLYLPAAIRNLPDAAGIPGAAALLAGWILPVFILMSAVATKLPHYVLPAWPGLVVLIAGSTAALVQHQRSVSRPTLLAGLWLFLPVGLLLSAGLLVIPWLLPVRALRVPAASAGLVCLALTLSGARLFLRRRHAAALFTLMAGMGILVLTVALRLNPALETLKISPALAAAIRAHTPATVPVATRGYSEPSLNFYLARGPVESLGSDEEVVAWVRRPGEGVLVIPARELGGIARRHRWRALDNVTVLAAVRGFNYSRGQWMEVLAVQRSNPR